MKSAFAALPLAAVLLTGEPAMAETWTVATQYEEHRPFDTPAEAEAYAERLCTSIYSNRNETSYQLPFHATDNGDTWRVVGSRPYGYPFKVDPANPAWPVTGPLTIVVEKATGRVTDVHFTLAPAGWDAAIMSKRGRNPDPNGKP